MSFTLPSAVRGGSTRVFNRMSLRNDHGGYWDNDEEFVLPVARLIDLAPGGRDASRFFPEPPAAPEEDPAQIPPDNPNEQPPAPVEEPPPDYPDELPNKG